MDRIAGEQNIYHGEYGANAMCTQCSASLMLEVTQGGLYGINTRILLNMGCNRLYESIIIPPDVDRRKFFGFGIPPGSLLLNKIGLAYDNLNDFALIKLQSGVEFIITVYST